MAIITLSRQFGVGGVEITRRLAERLGYQYFSREITNEVAKRMGLSSKIIKEYEEFMQHTCNWGFDSFGGRFKFSKKNSVKVSDYFEFINEIIHSLAKEGNVIILGRGGQCILKDDPQAFHFRLVADLQDRVKHIISHYTDPSEVPPRKMLEYKLQIVDNARARYIKLHFNEEIENPLLYHGVLNLSRLGAEKVIELIMQMIDVREMSFS